MAETLDPTSPYAILEQVPTRTVLLADVEITVGATLPQESLSQVDYDAWVRQSATVVSTFFGRFPVPRLRLALLGTNGKGVRFGNAYGERGAALRIYVGEETDRQDLMVKDWVLVHEMVHTAVPKLRQSHHWLEEGIATYVESIARLQTGHVSAETVWGGFAEGMPNGLPGQGESGLDFSDRWGSTYWGGALFCLLADYQIRQRTDNRMGLQHALRGLPQGGASIEQRWPVERVIALADEATGTTVLAELYQSMGQRSMKIDLEKLWNDLGVVMGGNSVRFDEAAPEAHIRRAIGQGPSGL
jgi:hypothetical protein